MTYQQKFIWLLGGLTVLLTIASLTGWALARRVRDDAGRAVIDNLRTRVRAWWVMIAVFAAAFMIGSGGTIVLFALISFLALREFLTLTPTRPADHRAMSMAFFAVIPLQYWLIHTEWYAMFAIFIPVYCFLLLPSLSALAEDPEHFLERTAKIQWGVMVAVYCISHVPALLILEVPGYAQQNALLLFHLLLVIQMSDVLQYVFGKLLGRTKLAPLTSPSKTVEGLVGGGLAATAVGAAMWWITPFTPGQAAAISAVTVVMGFLGGLVLSAVKRSLGAKDWGTAVPGHGGMLDRMDSVAFAAPIYFHITRYFFTA